MPNHHHKEKKRFSYEDFPNFTHKNWYQRVPLSPYQ